MNRPYPIITVKDSRGGFIEAITEMAEIMKKGGGVGFDLRQVTPAKQKGVQAEIEKEMTKLHIKGLKEFSYLSKET